MKKFLGVLSFALLSLIACKNDDGEGVLALQFSAKVNNAPLAFNQYYVINGDSVKFEVLKFYVSNFNIEDKDGTKAIQLKDVAIIDLKNENMTTISSTLEATAYKNPSFNIGLTNEQNESEPTSYPSDHPLSAQTANYWMMANSYIYIKLEGQYRLNGVEESFVYHIGANDYAKNKQVEKTFTIHNGNTTTLNANFNLNNVFANIDFATESTSHEAGALAEKINTNFFNSLSVN